MTRSSSAGVTTARVARPARHNEMGGIHAKRFRIDRGESPARTMGDTPSSRGRPDDPGRAGGDGPVARDGPGRRCRQHRVVHGIDGLHREHPERERHVREQLSLRPQQPRPLPPINIQRCHTLVPRAGDGRAWRAERYRSRSARRLDLRTDGVQQQCRWVDGLGDVDLHLHGRGHVPDRLGGGECVDVRPGPRRPGDGQHHAQRQHSL